MLKKIVTGAIATGLLFLATGCNAGAPRPRLGSLPTPPPGPRFLNPNKLGKHSYHFNPFEKNVCVVLKQVDRFLNKKSPVQQLGLDAL